MANLEQEVVYEWTIFLMAILLPMMTLAAYGGGRAEHHPAGHARQQPHAAVHPNQAHRDAGRVRYDYNRYGGYGAGEGYYGDGVAPVVDPQPQPGMGGDTDSLYQSYIRSNPPPAQ
ncbi:MAG: hypothetical protein ACXU9U_00995 [Parachlamydiaceae bacterium]